MTPYHRILPEKFFEKPWKSLKGFWHDQEYRRTIFAVILIGCITFAGAAIYDNYSGGPEARQASIDSKAVLDGFADIIARSECATSYTNADNVAQANLLLAFGSIIESAAIGEEITEEQIVLVHDARIERREYLILRDEINQHCNPKRAGGPDTLREDEMPEIISIDDIN